MTAIAPSIAEIAPEDDKREVELIQLAADQPDPTLVKSLGAASGLDTGPPILSRRHLRFLACFAVVCMCAGDIGFDGTVMSSTNSIEEYQRYFHLEAASKGTSLVFGLYTLGQVCAFFPVSYLPDKVGRRWTMLIGSVVLIAGAIVTSLATSSGMFYGGRFLTGLGCSTAAAPAKAYVAEITTPRTRGRYVGVLNSSTYIGTLLAAGLAIRFGKFHNTEWGWRGVLLCQVAMPAIVIVFIMFQPESPRWLYANGRQEEAAKILARFHSRDENVQSPFIQLQLAEIEQSISLDGADKRFWDFRRIVRDRPSRYRFGMCLIISIGPTLSGGGLITYFLPVLLGQAGITSTDKQRVLNLVNSASSFFCAIVGSLIVDHVGRRKLMLTSATANIFGNAIVAALVSGIGTDSSSMRSNAGVAFIFLFQVFNSIGWTPMTGIYSVENLSFENRAKGLALQGWIASAFSMINTFGGPVALQHLRWKTYLIFLSFNVVTLIVVYLFAVETQGLSLEELDEVFEASNPKKRSFELTAAVKRERQMAEEQQV